MSPNIPSAKVTVATSGASSSDLERLNPFAGLFLRSEHLNLMQDYSRELSYLVGESGGGGVVRGYSVTVEYGDQPAVVVGPGLAITAEGEPLRSTKTIRIPLSSVQPSSKRFWWIEIASSKRPAGDEPVAGALCDAPSIGAGGSSGRPRLAMGVVASLKQDTAEGLLMDPPRDASFRTPRNWLASWVFREEARAAGRWQPGVSRPDKDPGPLGQTSSTDFAPDENVVRLGVLLGSTPTVTASAGKRSNWVVDIWAARRDRGAPPPTRDWQWRLAMRPWDVFVAQVLQFQQEAAELQAASFTGTSKVKNWVSLPTLGITELPPAAFLPRVGGNAGEIIDDVQKVLRRDARDGQLNITYCWCAPGDIGERLARAQHRDRIPLVTKQGMSPLRLYVPATQTAEGEGEPVWTPTGDWVLLVRDEEVSCLEVIPEFERKVPGCDVLVGRYRTDAAYEQARAALESGARDIPGAESVGAVISLRSEQEGTLPSAHSHGYEEILDSLRTPHREAVIASTAPPGRPFGGVARVGMVRRLLPKGVKLEELEPVESEGDERVVVLIREKD